MVEIKSMDQESIHLYVERELKALITMESLLSAWFLLIITELLSFTSFSGHQKTYLYSSKRSNVVSIICTFPHTQTLNSSCFKFTLYYYIKKIGKIYSMIVFFSCFFFLYLIN